MKEIGFGIMFLGLCASIISFYSDIYAIAYTALLAPPIGLLVVIAAVVLESVIKIRCRQKDCQTNEKSEQDPQNTEKKES